MRSTDLGADPRAELRALEQRARRRFGQHFLNDLDVVQRIVRGARIQPGDRVVEIGPGLGILTGALLRTGAELQVVELDRDLAAYLADRVPGLTIHQADALRMDWAGICPGSGHKVVANLPYNVGTTVTMQLLRRPRTFASVTVMLQLEVVQRMLSEPGSKVYGALSVEVQARARPTFILGVDPSRFVPAPRVHSAVVRFELYPEPRVGAVAPEAFDAVVRAAFAQRRKTLLNALGARFGRGRAGDALDRAGIGRGLRAARVDLGGYRSLAEALADEPQG
ncbi:MAG TPA: ribosomal RNA small subunit methyltransferase A [Deltaproteobacteria bacterium]|nr:ribosomal RNA small subunit methyltransferase A [Deltaproteobacteria bacterium]